jgi:hypothetical protein
MCQVEAALSDYMQQSHFEKLTAAQLVNKFCVFHGDSSLEHRPHSSPNKPMICLNIIVRTFFARSNTEIVGSNPT